jgi:HPt (histidine-containing phosphotransfer) domain-containing protein
MTEEYSKVESLVDVEKEVIILDDLEEDELDNLSNETQNILGIIPNNLGINLCSVDKIEIIRQKQDNQLVKVDITFIPDNANTDYENKQLVESFSSNVFDNVEANCSYVKAIRGVNQALESELDAANVYEQLLDLSDEITDVLLKQEIKNVATDILNEEKEHFGQLTALKLKIDEFSLSHYENGFNEGKKQIADVEASDVTISYEDGNF